MGLDNEYDFVKKFGFGEKTGIDLPGESKGIMFKKSAMGELEQATVAFGQGLSVTPIQLVTAFSAIINGGTLYTPYITKSINDPITHDAILEYKPTAKRKVISEDTSKKMRYALKVLSPTAAVSRHIPRAIKSVVRPVRHRLRKTVCIPPVTTFCPF